MQEFKRQIAEKVMITQVPTAAELRSRSSWLLAHARHLREEAEQARVRAVERREQSKKAVASLREHRCLSEDALKRYSLQYGARS
jgi:hypothetical protein